jgi:hypothetical protein
MTHTRILLAVMLVSEAGCLFHHGQPIIAVTEGQFRFEIKPTDPPPEAYHPISLPLSKTDSDNLEKFLIAGGNTANASGSTSAAPAAAREYKEFLQLLRDKKWTYEQVLDQHVFRKWFPKVQVGGVVDARRDEPPKMPPLAAKRGRYWWVFYVRGHDLTGLVVFEEAVPPPKPRRKQ